MGTIGTAFNLCGVIPDFVICTSATIFFSHLLHILPPTDKEGRALIQDHYPWFLPTKITQRQTTSDTHCRFLFGDMRSLRSLWMFFLGVSFFGIPKGRRSPKVPPPAHWPVGCHPPSTATASPTPVIFNVTNIQQTNCNHKYFCKNPQKYRSGHIYFFCWCFCRWKLRHQPSGVQHRFIKPSVSGAGSFPLHFFSSNCVSPNHGLVSPRNAFVFVPGSVWAFLLLCVCVCLLGFFLLSPGSFSRPRPSLLAWGCGPPFCWNPDSGFLPCPENPLDVYSKSGFRTGSIGGRAGVQPAAFSPASRRLEPLPPDIATLTSYHFLLYPNIFVSIKEDNFFTQPFFWSTKVCRAFVSRRTTGTGIPSKGWMRSDTSSYGEVAMCFFFGTIFDRNPGTVPQLKWMFCASTWW